MCLVLWIFFVILAMPLLESEEIMKNQIILHYFEKHLCLLIRFYESILIAKVREKNLQESNKDSIQHFKTAFLKIASVYIWLLRKKKRAFLFSVFFLYTKKKTTVMRLIANYFCTHTWKTCWYCEYNIIKFHYEITTTIKVSSEILVQE